MITKKQSIIQNIILSLFFVVSTTILFTNCRGDEDVYSEPQITISPEGDIAFGSGVESKTITINTNRPWRIVKEENSDWIDISPMEGKRRNFYDNNNRKKCSCCPRELFHNCFIHT